MLAGTGVPYFGRGVGICFLVFSCVISAKLVSIATSYFQNGLTAFFLLFVIHAFKVSIS